MFHSREIGESGLPFFIGDGIFRRMTLELAHRLTRWLGLGLLLSFAFPVAAAVEIAHRPASPLERYLLWLKTQLPMDRPEAGYVGSSRCRECHVDEHASWHRSYHRTMTQPATAEAVLGKFDGSTIQCGALAYRAFQEDGRYWAEMPDPDVLMYVVQGGKKLELDKIPRVRRPVVMTTGSHHYQTYWVTSPRYPGLLQTLPLVFLIEDQRWIPRDVAFMRAPDDTERLVTQWNHHCIRCHSTGGNPGLDSKGQLRSRVGELGIACEACHGPGEAHVEKHRLTRSLTGSSSTRAPDPTIVQPARLDHERSSQVCGQCHGVYIMRDEFAMESARNGPLYFPGEDLFRTRYYVQHPQFAATTNRPVDSEKNRAFYAERWWDDGTILAGGREFTGLLASACYTRGKMSCLSCHSMHDSDPNDQLSRRGTSSASCTQCHQEARYTTDLAQHTFHPPESSGSDCRNCHMPHTTYALFKGIRSHQINSPRVEASVQFGTPNACNLCHLDQTLAWTQQHLSRWYRHREIPLSAEQTNTAASLLWLLKGHAAQRVISAWHFGWPVAQQASGTNWLAPGLSYLLGDPYGPVRYVAARSLRSLPGFRDFKFDFLASETERVAAKDRAIRQWKLTVAPPATNHTVLLNGPGQFDEVRAAKLWQDQDTRGVTIQE